MLLSGLVSIARAYHCGRLARNISRRVGLVVGINFLRLRIAFILLSQSVPEGTAREGSIAGSTSTKS